MTLPAKSAGETAKLSTEFPSNKPSKGFSKSTVDRLNNLSADDKARVIEVASKLIAKRAKREIEATDGRVDLTKRSPIQPSPSSRAEWLTPDEIEDLRNDAKQASIEMRRFLDGGR